MEVFERGKSWYVYRRWDISVLESVFEVLVEMTRAWREEVDMWATTLAWYAPRQEFVVGERIVASSYPLDYLPESLTVPGSVGKGEGNATLKGYEEGSADQKTTLEMARKMDSMNREGFYNYFGSVTVKSDVRVFMAIAEVFKEEVAKITDVRDLQVYIVFNPLTVETIRMMGRRGGNALGIEVEDGPLTSKILFSLYPPYLSK